MENSEIIIQKLESINSLLATMIEKINHTNDLLSRGLKSQWGHNMTTLEMDPERFKKSEALRQKTPH